MNRQKYIKDTLKKRAKKANAKLNKSNKPRYISKAEREKLAQEAALNPSETVLETAPENIDVAITESSEQS